MESHDRLRLLAIKAREGMATWWLWDEPRPEGSGPILQFAHAASPETVLALLDEIQQLREALRQMGTAWHEEQVAAGADPADAEEDVRESIAPGLWADVRAEDRSN